ncbi:hypothetical protein MIDIC_240061 [Alphaproteobacteria bacterium]
MNFHIKGEQGNIIAGINALMYCWGIVYIDVLAVDEDHRSTTRQSLAEQG